MQNYLSEGKDVTLAAPTGGVVSGTVYQIGQLLLVAATTVAQTLPFVGRTVGVFSVPKVGSQAWTVGAVVYWDDTNKYFTVTATGSMLAGVALVAVGSGAGETTGVVRLNGNARPDEA